MYYFSFMHYEQKKKAPFQQNKKKREKKNEESAIPRMGPWPTGPLQAWEPVQNWRSGARRQPAFLERPGLLVMVHTLHGQELFRKSQVNPTGPNVIKAPVTTYDRAGETRRRLISAKETTRGVRELYVTRGPGGRVVANGLFRSLDIFIPSVTSIIFFSNLPSL